MLGRKPFDIPMDPNQIFKEDDGERLIDVGEYKRLVGRLINLSLTQPNIAFDVSVISQFMHALTTVHPETEFTRYLDILKGTLANGKGLLFVKKDGLHVEAYIDANWACSVSEKQSTSGYCPFVGGNHVSWRTKK